MAGWNAGKIDGLDAVVAANFRRRSPGGLNSNDLAAFKKILSDFRVSYPDTKVVLDESHYLKDQSFHLWTFTGTNTGPGATPPTGKSVKRTGATRVRYRDGKIAEELVYFDALDWQTQLGFTLTPPAPAKATKAAM